MPKQISLFIVKCLTFSLIFFSSWLLLFRPVNSYLNERASSQAQESDSYDSDALMKKYWEQFDRSDQIMRVTEDHQKKQAELLARWEKVIEKWENR